MAYYMSETCNGSDQSGCTNEYAESEIKYVVDAWAVDKFQNSELKEVDEYSARLITIGEYAAISNIYTWRYNSKSIYWTMSPWMGWNGKELSKTCTYQVNEKGLNNGNVPIYSGLYNVFSRSPSCN